MSTISHFFPPDGKILHKTEKLLICEVLDSPEIRIFVRNEDGILEIFCIGTKELLKDLYEIGKLLFGEK